MKAYLRETEKISSKLKELRIKQKLSQSDIAKKLGICTSAVCLYEAGKRVPSDFIKIKYSKLFGKSVEELFF